MILDTASVYYRGFYALPGSLRGTDGRPVNAVRGLLDITTTLLSRYHPDRLICAWDADWRPRWRVDLVPTYKAHRVAAESSDGSEEAPSELVEQVPVIREVLATARVPVVGEPGWEADDVVATLAARHSASSDAGTLVVTGDRDMFQVVGPRTRVAYLGRGVAHHDLADEEWLVDHVGVRPERYVDYATLRGDPSDGLPGAPGIGEKTAARLVDRFGDIDAILRAASDPDAELRPGVRRSLLENSDYLLRARQVTRAAADVPLTAEEGLSVPIDAERAASLQDTGDRWGLGTSWTRFVTALTATREIG